MGLLFVLELINTLGFFLVSCIEQFKVARTKFKHSQDIKLVLV